MADEEDGFRIESGMTTTGNRKAPRWVGPFLRMLERTGEVRSAADWVGIDHTTAYLRRKAHADFAAAWDAALVEHAVAKARAEDQAVEAIRGGSTGALPLGPSTIASSGNGPPPRSGEDLNGRWTPAAEKRFFAALADRANVKHAARAAGFSTNAIYQRRAKNKVFAAAWDAAVETGKSRLQMLLIDAAERNFDPELVVPEADTPKVSASEAIRLLQTREGKERERRLSIDEEAARLNEEELEKLRLKLLKKLDRLRDREVAARLAEGWQMDGEHLIPPGWVRDPGGMS